MSKQHQTPAMSKKQIALQTKQLDSDYMSARNDFERVKALQSMRALIESELDNWIMQLESYSTLSKADQVKLTPDAKLRISELNELVEQINELCAPQMVSAINIQNVMIRENKLKKPVIV